MLKITTTLSLYMNIGNSTNNQWTAQYSAPILEPLAQFDTIAANHDISTKYIELVNHFEGNLMLRNHIPKEDIYKVLN